MVKTPPNSSQLSYPTNTINKSYLESLFQSLHSVSGVVEATQAWKQLAQFMRLAEGQEFQLGLKGVNILFKKGHTSMLISEVHLLKKMMNYFTRLGRQLQRNGHHNTEFLMLYVLSIIAELIRKNPKFYFPFKRQFLLTIFRIDYDLLSKSPRRRDILAILATIYQNLSRQGRLINKYSMVEMLKTSLLEKYSLIDEIFTLQAFNRALSHLADKGVSFSTQQFLKHKIFEVLKQFIQKRQLQLFAVKINIASVQLGKHSFKNQVKDQENV